MFPGETIDTEISAEFDTTRYHKFQKVISKKGEITRDDGEKEKNNCGKKGTTSFLNIFMKHKVLSKVPFKFKR